MLISSRFSSVFLSVSTLHVGFPNSNPFKIVESEIRSETECVSVSLTDRLYYTVFIALLYDLLTKTSPKIET
jgi:hypothetical protein